MESASELVPFPLLLTPIESNYRACTIPYRFSSDNPRKPTPIELQWIDVFYNVIPSFKYIRFLYFFYFLLFYFSIIAYCAAGWTGKSTIDHSVRVRDVDLVWFTVFVLRLFCFYWMGYLMGRSQYGW